MKRNVYTVVLVSWLTGCAIAPGMRMDDTLPNVPGVTIRPITADLIHTQRVNEEREAPRPSAIERSRSDNRYQYRIGPHDILNIVVWDHPDLTVPAGQNDAAEAVGYLVSEDGTIFFPYVGTVKVAGMTAVEVRNILTQRVTRRIVNPQVDVRVTAYRSQKVYVVGEVKQPGLMPITDVPLTVIEAVSQAGGLTPDADLMNVTLTRNGSEEAICDLESESSTKTGLCHTNTRSKVYDIDLLAIYQEGDTTQNRILQDGDLLRVPNRNKQKIFVLGEVGNPSSLLMNQGTMTLTEAISDAGGVDPITSNPERIYVIRSNGDESEIYHLNAESPDALILSDQFQLRPHDVVYVETAGVSRWSRVIRQLLPVARVSYGID